MLKEIERDATCTSYCAIIESVREKLLADTRFLMTIDYKAFIWRFCIRRKMNMI